MNSESRSGPAAGPPTDLARRSLKISPLDQGVVLYRIHRTRNAPLHYGRESEPDRRQRWDAPDASYGVCYLAEEGHIAFAETLLRDLTLDALPEAEIEVRSLTRLRVRAPLRLVAMHGKALRAHGADRAVVQGTYAITWQWSGAFHGHADAPDGIYYRARHDDSGFSVALFERAGDRVECLDTVGLSDPGFARELARWLDHYEVGLTS